MIRAHRFRKYAESPLACVIGGIDIVRPLALAGIRCAAVVADRSPANYSRFVEEVLDPQRPPEELVSALLEFAERQRQPPVLFYAADWNLRLVSQFRDRLQEGFCFVLPDAALIEDVVDKSRFQTLAAKLDLQVPRGQALIPGNGQGPAHVRLRFPLILKPLGRHTPTWGRTVSTKAVRLASRSELEALWPRLKAERLEVLVQELIDGPESRIESYHVYIDENYEIAAEFTGRKIRTYPPEFGYTSALTITDNADVVETGRRVSERLRLRGVAKLDFKRAPDGTLWLLEVNPRFNLWHHPGARAGVNIPELVYCDLAGLPRPSQGPVRVGVRWCSLRHDLQAAKAQRVGSISWVRWASRCEIKSPFSWRDPLPLFGGVAWRLRHAVRPGARSVRLWPMRPRKRRRPDAAAGGPPSVHN
jgi:predicted ATP-grasp superfamily ATP-dependent carboligase